MGLNLSRLLPGVALILEVPEAHCRRPATVLKIAPAAAPGRLEGELVRLVEFLYDDHFGRALHGQWTPSPAAVARWRNRRRSVTLRLDRPDGGRCDMALLRTVEWIARTGAAVGASVSLDLSEMGVVGSATVLAIEPCPEVKTPASAEFSNVTGTFRHSGAVVGDLTLDGEREPLGVTPEHPFWSADRQAWVPARRLYRGEHVKTLAGPTRVVSYVLRPTTTFRLAG